METVGESLTASTAATSVAALAVAVDVVETQRRPLPTRLAIVAMGRLGGQEMNYASDADVLFVHEPAAGADEREAQQAAMEVAQEMRRLLALPAADPPLSVDADLRPEGKQGSLVRSFASYQAYYSRWSQTWEAQALLRAEPLCGDPALQRRFGTLIDPLRWPREGLSARGRGRGTPGQGAHRRRTAAAGGRPGHPHQAGTRRTLADIEWTTQLLQLQHAGRVEGPAHHPYGRGAPGGRRRAA